MSGQSSYMHEVERDLKFIPIENTASSPSESEDGRLASNAGLQNRGAALSLPFFDEFSTPSMPRFDGIPPGFEEYQRWELGSARQTETFAIASPTIGAATLDGLNRFGEPYNFVEVNTSGWCDTLTSLPIALNGYFPESNVHLMFHYEAGGRGNAPDVNEDFLTLEFKSTDDVSGEVFWTEVWSSDSTSTFAFERVFVPVDQFPYLVNDFQFRFRNYGALAGNVDLWHLDYILLDDQINPTDFELVSEVAITEPIPTFLRDFTRMPWNHFIANPTYYMRDSLLMEQRNFGAQADNINWGFSIDYEGSVDVYETAVQNTNVQPETAFNTTLYIGTNPLGESFVFDAAVADTAATFAISVWQSSIGLLHTEKVGIPDNDSIVFHQVFDNDFAYDDGTAEKAYSLTAAGGKLAIRYSLEVPDTLLGLAIHFTPYYTDADDETFLLRAWQDSLGVPGAELSENYEFHTPQYFNDGYDLFAFYEYDDPIPVEGNIHVGLVQASEVGLNFGLDKNTNSNVGQLHYSLGLGGSWLNSEIQGSVMIRPVLRANKSEVWSEVADNNMRMNLPMLAYPNPVNGNACQVQVPAASSWQLWSAEGRLLQSGRWTSPGVFDCDLTGLAAGMYFLINDRGQSVQILRN
jgi:hypothetical protein